MAGPARRRGRPGPPRRLAARGGGGGRLLRPGPGRRRRGDRLDARRRLAPHPARPLPAGRPALPDAYLLTCSYFYDEEYLHGFRFLLQEIEAALKHRKVAALEAFGLRHTRGDDAFRGYFRELNLFNPDVLEGGGFQRVQEKGEVARFRLDLAALVEAPRRSVAWEQREGAGRHAAGLTDGASADGRAAREA